MSAEDSDFQSLVLEAIQDVQRMEQPPLVVEVKGFLFDLNDTEDIERASNVLENCHEVDMTEFHDFEVTDESGSSFNEHQVKRWEAIVAQGVGFPTRSSEPA